MKDFYIADAARFENQPVTSFFLLAGISARDRKGGGQYLALTLADKTGQFEARMWDDFADAVSSCTAGCYVKVQGQVSRYQGKFQITLSKLRLAAAVEIDTADFIPTTQYDIPTMAAELRGYVTAFKNPHLRALVLSFLDDPQLGPQFIEAPAAKRLHHAWIGGLLEHVVSLVRVCLATAPFYPEVDPELLVTGAILHDIGKVRELSWASSFDYTLEGQLIGHISIAQGMLHEKIALLDAAASQKELSSRPESAHIAAPVGGSLPEPGGGADAAEGPVEAQGGPFIAPASGAMSGVNDAEPANLPLPSGAPSMAQPHRDMGGVQDAEPASQPLGPFPQKLRLLIEHMILSHHGKLEFGSPKLPMTPEAMLLSALDDLEAKFQALRNEFAAAKAAGRPASEPTEWVRSMERPLFNSQAWLETQIDRTVFSPRQEPNTVPRLTAMPSPPKELVLQPEGNEDCDKPKNTKGGMSLAEIAAAEGVSLDNLRALVKIPPETGKSKPKPVETTQELPLQPAPVTRPQPKRWWTDRNWGPRDEVNTSGLPKGVTVSLADRSETSNAYLNGCAGKQRYATEAHAIEFLEWSKHQEGFRTSDGSHPYFCNFCGGWHVGHSR